jgi:hypothetical protein
MKPKPGYGRIVAGCVLCAGAAYAAAGCATRPKAGAVPVTITYAEDARITFADAKGQTETALTIGKESRCTGSAEGKTAYRQDSCSFPPSRGTIGGDTVTVHWSSPSGSGVRSATDAVTLTRTLGLRVVKSGVGGYDCATTDAGALKLTTVGQAPKSATDAVTLAERRDRPRVTFATGPTCSIAQKGALEAALVELRNVKEIVNVACW